MTGGMVMWRAGCGESRTSGSEGGPGRRTSRKAQTAPCARPYFGAYLWRAVPAPEVTTAAYRGVEPSLLHELDTAFFDDRFQAATPLEREVLLSMAREAGAVNLATIRTRLPETQGAAELASRLVERGLLYRHGRGTYDFALPLFRPYLRRQAEITGITPFVISGRGGR